MVARAVTVATILRTWLRSFAMVGSHACRRGLPSGAYTDMMAILVC